MQTMHVHGGVRAAHQTVTLEDRVRISAVDPFIQLNQTKIGEMKT